MKKRSNVLVVLLVTGGAAAVVACSGSGSGSVDEKDTSPTLPGEKGSSGATAPGSSGSSGASGGTSGSSGTTGSSGSASGGGGGGDDAGTDGPAANCVAKGYAGNDKKIGAYCDKDIACPFQLEPFLVCTYGHDTTNTHLFCTSPCSKDSECGTGAYCVHSPDGNGCVPTQCGGVPGT